MWPSSTCRSRCATAWRLENLFPVTLCHTSTLKRFGTRAVIGGRGGGDDDPDQPCSLGAVMRKLEA